MSDSVTPGSSVLGLLQARTLERVAIPSCRGSQSRIPDWFFPTPFPFCDHKVFFSYVCGSVSSFFRINWLMAFGCAAFAAVFSLPLAGVGWSFRGAPASHCSGFPPGAQALGSQASGVVAYRLSCSAACGILPDQGSNPCPLHWQSDSQPLDHQGSPESISVL